MTRRWLIAYGRMLALLLATLLVMVAIGCVRGAL